MRREMMGARAMLWVAMASIVISAIGCTQSATARADDASARTNREAVVRRSATVERVAIPKDSGRLLYDAPTDLSLANAIRTRAPITGIDSAGRSHP
jgi:hypothetical protein